MDIIDTFVSGVSMKYSETQTVTNILTIATVIVYDVCQAIATRVPAGVWLKYIDSILKSHFSYNLASGRLTFARKLLESLIFRCSVVELNQQLFTN